jgi:RHS repeat-associated protein
MPVSYSPVPMPFLKDMATFTRHNYVRTIVPDEPRQTWTTQPTYHRQITAYYDGLGRPLQTVAQKAHAEGYDIIQPYVYDSAGRANYSYQPFAMPEGLSYGNFQKNAYSYMRQFYDIPYPDEPPYSKTEYDNSALSKVFKTLAPGRSWVGSDRGISYSYASNTSPLIPALFPLLNPGNGLTALPVYTGNYPVNSLQITNVTDEDGKISISVKDKSGKQVLSGKVIQPPPMGSPLTPQYLAMTLYVYDALDRLRYVLPPKACSAAFTDQGGGQYSWNITPGILEGLCYCYLYDEQGNLVEKKLPGKACEFYVYDKRDRQVYYQDGNLRNKGRIAFTFYDVLDRPIAGGEKAVQALSRTALAAQVNSTASAQPSDFLYYIQNYNLYHSYPPGNMAGVEFHSFNYYDDYSMLTGFAYDPGQYNNISITAGYICSPGLSTQTRGKVTGLSTLVADPDVPGTATWISKAIYYDDKGRVLQTQSRNHKGGLELSSNIYYFQGMLWKNIYRHNNPDALAVPGAATALTTMRVEKTFEHSIGPEGGSGKVWKVTQKINDGLPYELAYYSYDHLGRPVVAQFPAAVVLKEYNMRGFLNHIDAESHSGSTVQPLFEERLCYDKGFTNKLYNGNIAGITWSTSQPGTHAYGYHYDEGDRLAHAEYRFQQQGSTAWSNAVQDYTASNMAYDNNGNILSMNQKVKVDLPNNPAPVDMDQLTYTYKDFSNELVKVRDNIAPATTQALNLPDFKDAADQSLEYGYDANGNLISDLNKKIQQIEYNQYNKPVRITMDNGASLSYTYASDGSLLQKKVKEGSNPAVVYDYFGTFIYKDNVLQSILHDEGRARPTTNGTNGETRFVYDYFIKDHLGNVRSTVTAEPINGSYLAGHELAFANVEQLVFDNIPNVRAAKPGSSSNGDDMAAKLVASDPAARIGTAIMLRTMPGDRFAISADAYFEGTLKEEGKVSAADLAASLMSTLMGGNTYDGVPIGELPKAARTIKTTLSNPAFATGLAQLLGQHTNPNAPQAHLNYLFFDEGLNLILKHSGIVQVPGSVSGWTTIGPAPQGGSTGIGQIATDQPGYVIIYIDNQSIGKDVWFDNVHVEHYTSSIQEENQYYPYGLALTQHAGTPGIADQPYKYQSIELEKHFDLEMYETFHRGLDPQLGRFMQIDPLVEKHYDINPYVSMGNNPVRYIDPRGDDWFVNNTDGEVVYLKNVTEPNGLAFMKAGFNGPPSEYDRLGPNNMFGNEVEDANGNNMLERNVFRLSNSEAFMKGRGYAKAENVEIKETEYTTSGSFGAGERVSQSVTDLSQIGDSKITYVKPPELNKKIVETETHSMETYSSSKSILYNLTKPFGQPNSKTAEYGGNRTMMGTNSSNVSTGAKVGGQLYKIIKGILTK